MLPYKIEICETHAVCRPTGVVTLNEAFDMLCQIVQDCVKSEIRKLLIDATGVTGFKAPDTMDRYAFGQQVAGASRGMVTLAFVFREELIDPQRFGLLVARNRGLSGELFTSEKEAVEWLLSFPPSS